VVAIYEDVTERKQAEESLRRNEEKFRSIVEMSTEWIWTADLEGKHAYSNPAVKTILGYAPEEIVGRDIVYLIQDNERRRLKEHLSAAIANKQGWSKQVFHCRHKDGAYRIMESNAAPVFDIQQNIVGFYGVNRDITEHKRAEAEIRTMTAFLDSIVENIPDMIFVKDAKDLRFIRLNRAGENLLGYDRKELLGKNDYDFFPKEQADFFTENDCCVLQEKHTVDIPEEPIRTRGRGERILHTKKVPILDPGGEPSYLLGISEDITERKRAEELLLRQRRELEQVIDSMVAQIWYLDLYGRVVNCNRTARTVSGTSVEEARGKTIHFLAPGWDDLERRHGETLAVARTGVSLLGSVESFLANGEVRWVRVDKVPWRDASESIIGVILFIYDITERKRADAALREAQRRLEDIIEFLPDATLVIDKEGKVIAWNRAIETMTGIKKEDMLGKGDYEYSLPFYGERRPIIIDLALKMDEDMEKKYTTVHRVGDMLFGESYTPNLPPGNVHLSATASVLRDSRGEVIAAIECIRDNTERKQIEERLNRAEKMEALGTLAGGVAHDLNNVLGVLVGYSELLLDKLPEDGPLKRFANNILESSIKGAAIIQDLLTLARRGVAVSEVVKLNRL